LLHARRGAIEIVLQCFIYFYADKEPLHPLFHKSLLEHRIAQQGENSHHGAKLFVAYSMLFAVNISREFIFWRTTRRPTCRPYRESVPGHRATTAYYLDRF